MADEDDFVSMYFTCTPARHLNGEARLRLKSSKKSCTSSASD